jgi:hypothetical protein
MRVLSAPATRGDVEPMVRLAVRLRALGTQVRVCAPRNRAVAEGRNCDAPVATGVMPTGG